MIQIKHRITGAFFLAPMFAVAFFLAPIARAETTDAGTPEVRIACDSIARMVTTSASLQITPAMIERASPIQIEQTRATASKVVQINALARQCVARAEVGVIPNIEKSESVAKALTSALDAEVKCRATPQCLRDRDAKSVATQLCNTIQARARLVQQIAHERANPGGVVDLNLLHSLGEEVQMYDVMIADGRVTYAAYGKPLVCQ